MISIERNKSALGYFQCCNGNIQPNKNKITTIKNVQ